MWSSDGGTYSGSSDSLTRIMTMVITIIIVVLLIIIIVAWLLYPCGCHGMASTPMWVAMAWPTCPYVLPLHCLCTHEEKLLAYL